MKTATAKELRNKASAILESVQKGNEVIITKRGKSIAVLKPLRKVERKFNPIGFGIWRKREDLKDVKDWLNERRKERYQR
jgi:prevent-host-death family protein